MTFLSYRGLSLGILGLVLFSGAYFVIPNINPLIYSAENNEVSTTAEVSEPPITHLNTPEPLRAIYMSQCVAGSKDLRNELVKLIDETELNAVVIDIKDYSGQISFPTNNPVLHGAVSETCRATDMKDFIRSLHARSIYVIGRITVFQDPYMVKIHPEFAVKKASDGSVWKDYKGLSFIEVGAKPHWDYIVTLGKEAYQIGFDELNFDYIRFPSDGNMEDIAYTYSGNKTKAEVLKDFFAYLNSNLKSSGVVLSADLFGMTTTNTDDLNIGQVLENTLPYFDYINPMVYPSHYPPGFHGYANPNKYPYEVVNFSMTSAVERTIAASTTPSKLRPWLQDFDYGGNYDVPEIKAQMKATYDAGLSSWMLWSPSNRYTKGALDSEP